MKHMKGALSARFSSTYFPSFHY
uniref:Uncharacterized protein n=1 Tax=Arundo donax TaxID=35708 RepID=A0A0A9HA85_ARUDO